jgi:hypothetical protein
VRESEADGAAVAGPWPAGAAWSDGRYCPIEEAKISVLDLGVTRSDCTYDVVHVWDGRFYRLDAHLDRFGGSRDLRTARATFYCFAVPFVWITEGPGYNVFAHVDGR